MTWNDGAMYDGDWVMGQMHGFGTEIRGNGTLRHKGEFKDGLPSGGKYSRILSTSSKR
jgi:MORN repeat